MNRHKLQDCGLTPYEIGLLQEYLTAKQLYARATASVKNLQSGSHNYSKASISAKKEFERLNAILKDAEQGFLSRIVSSGCYEKATIEAIKAGELALKKTDRNS